MLAVLAAAYVAAWRLPQPGATHQLASADVVADTTTVPVSSPVAPASPPDPEPAPCPSHRLVFEPLNRSEQPVSLHHYVGTVGGQPVTVLLDWPTDLSSIGGTFYRHRGGPTYGLSLAPGTSPGKRPATLVLQVSDPASAGGRNDWHLTGWPGAVLRGTWHDTTGARPVLLRESYAGAVRADMQLLKLVGGRPYRTEYGDGACRWGSYKYAYLQFRGPWPVAPELRRTLGPPLAEVRRRVRAAFNDSRDEERLLTGFLLNDFNLLSYHVARYSTFITDEHGDDWVEFYLFDLATGRQLTVASQLRPGYEPRLNRLIKQHLLHDDQFDFVNKDHRTSWIWQDSTRQAASLTAPPETDPQNEGDPSGLSLAGSGLKVEYSGGAIFDLTSQDYLEFGRSSYTVEIPYRELRPLVRPGTPLARMLRARGIW